MPFPFTGQIAHPSASSSPINSIRNQILPPKRPVLPVAVMKLYHNLLGRIFGIQIYPSEKLLFSVSYFVRITEFIYHNLCIAFTFSDERFFAGKHGFGGTNKLPSRRKAAVPRSIIIKEQSGSSSDAGCPYCTIPYFCELSGFLNFKWVVLGSVWIVASTVYMNSIGCLLYTSPSPRDS